MNVVIAAATELEMIPFKQFVGEKNGATIEFCLTGVGAIATTYHLEKYISQFQPNLIIQVGIAGAFVHTYKLGTAVAIEEELVSDMGVFELDGYKDIFDLKLTDKDKFPFADKKLINPHQTILMKTGLPLVRSIGVNEISTSLDKINLFKNHFKADIETMEGSAFHYVCLMNNIPFVQLRGISNLVGERDKKKWKITDAVNATVNAYSTLLTNLNTTKK